MKAPAKRAHATHARKHCRVRENTTTHDQTFSAARTINTLRHVVDELDKLPIETRSSQFSLFISPCTKRASISTRLQQREWGARWSAEQHCDRVALEQYSPCERVQTEQPARSQCTAPICRRDFFLMSSSSASSSTRFMYSSKP